jgi:UDP-N-acetylglucosamine 3-dehydrogenase
MTGVPLRVALIGTGKIAELGHLPGFVRAGAEVVALCSRTLEELQQSAETYGVERRYTDWRQMLVDGGFDAVSICTPPALHREMTVGSLEHGYHTLVEKPMAISLDECQAMIDAAEHSDKILMVAHNQRFRAQHRFAKDILDSGRLGQVWRVHAAFAHGGPEKWSPTQDWYFNPGRGVLIDLGYHKIDLLRWLLGQDVERIQAFTATFEKPTTADDTAVAVLRFEQGVLAILEVSWAQHPDLQDSIMINCERGTLSVPSQPDEPVRVVEQRSSDEIIEMTFRPDPSAGPGWFEMVDAFVQAIRVGDPSPVSGREGKATLDSVLRAYASFGA